MTKRAGLPLRNGKHPDYCDPIMTASWSAQLDRLVPLCPDRGKWRGVHVGRCNRCLDTVRDVLIVSQLLDEPAHTETATLRLLEGTIDILEKRAKAA